MSPSFGGGFLQGFVQTTSMLQRLQLAKQKYESQQAAEKERIRLLQQRLKGSQATLELAQQEFNDRIQQRAQLAAQRANAASAVGLLNESSEQRGFQLDPQAQGELQGIVQKQIVGEQGGPALQKLLDLGKQFRNRRELTQILSGFLDDSEFQFPAVRQFGKAALNAYSSGQLDAQHLFTALDKITGAGGTISSRLQLAFLAAGHGPRAQQALKAIQLLPPEEQRTTVSSLAAIASGLGNVTPEQQKAAREALKRIEKIRATGVSDQKSRSGSSSFLRHQPAPSLPQAQPQLTPLPGGGVHGTGQSTLPRVRSFKRIK